MAAFSFGVRLHDYGRDTPQTLFQKVMADGWTCGQLAFRMAIEGVRDYPDITPALVAETKAALDRTGFSVAVLGTYVELAIDDDAVREKNVQTFLSQLPVCKALGAGCVGTETTSMALQPPGTTPARGRYLLCKSLERILPEAERLGVKVGIEPASWHSMNSPAAAREVLDAMRSPALGVIFDAGNLLSADAVDRQSQLWKSVREAFGERIVAVHFKGQHFAPGGSPVQGPLAGSVIDWDGAFAMLRTLPQPLPVLRKDAVPAMAAADLTAMRGHSRVGEAL